MGAKIMLCDPHRAVVMGHDFKSQLKATTMSSPDIRAGILLFAPLFQQKEQVRSKTLNKLIEDTSVLTND
jgi:UDP-N-acetylglucosamine enolpyruvyl transferase